VMAGLMTAFPGEWRASEGDAFTTLIRAVVGQQISVKAAETIWQRLCAAVGGMSPERCVDLTEEQGRGVGLSRQKSRYVQGIAQAFVKRAVHPEGWREMLDEAVLAELIALPGIGRWTAEMFLIFHLQRPDVFPVGDLGVLKAVARHYHAGESRSKPEILAIAEQWQPWRTVATWYLWRSL
jgi:DNA-3-methyladenine glycosylase II